jgi:hypothetical protein
MVGFGATLSKYANLMPASLNICSTGAVAPILCSTYVHQYVWLLCDNSNCILFGGNGTQGDCFGPQPCQMHFQFLLCPSKSLLSDMQDCGLFDRKQREHVDAHTSKSMQIGAQTNYDAGRLSENKHGSRVLSRQIRGSITKKPRNAEANARFRCHPPGR